MPMPIGTAPHVNVILMYGQVVTIPSKALLANPLPPALNAWVNVTVKDPVVAAVTCEHCAMLLGLVEGGTPLMHANVKCKNFFSEFKL